MVGVPTFDPFIFVFFFFNFFFFLHKMIGLLLNSMESKILYITRKTYSTSCFQTQFCFQTQSLLQYVLTGSSCLSTCHQNSTISISVKVYAVRHRLLRPLLLVSGSGFTIKRRPVSHYLHLEFFLFSLTHSYFYLRWSGCRSQENNSISFGGMSVTQRCILSG